MLSAQVLCAPISQEWYVIIFNKLLGNILV